jgi:hypothetical protein
MHNFPNPFFYTPEMQAAEEQRIAKFKQARELCQGLGLPMVAGLLAPHMPPVLDATQMVEILLDEVKLKQLLTKLKLRAFW